MKRHKRDRMQAQARIEIETALSDIEERYGLTDGEMTSILSGYMASMAKYMIRYERHGNTETPGGIEK